MSKTKQINPDSLVQPNDYGLHKHKHRKYAREFVDQDYIEKLDRSDLDWLDTFNKEYYGNQFKKSNQVHSPEQKKAIGQVNNERRRDVYALQRCSGKLQFNGDEDIEEIVELLENEVIEMIDERPEQEKQDKEFYWWDDETDS